MAKLNKKILIIGCSLTIVLALICTITLGQKTNGFKIKQLELPGNGDSIEIHDIKINIKDDKGFKAGADIYKFKKSSVNESDSKKIAAPFGIDQKVINLTDAYVIERGNKSIRVDKNTGMWNYGDYSKLHISPQGQVYISDDATVIEIAKNELKKYNVNFSSFDTPKVTYETEQIATEKNQRILAKNIYFYNKFNGQPILGTSRIIVTIGNNDELLSISKYFREVEEKPYKVKLKQQSAVLNDVKEGKAIINYDGKNKNPKQIDVSSVTLAYWEDESNDFLQPVYVLNGNNADDLNDLFVSYVPAVDDGQIVN
jgi:hypothetical protein